jgi:hydrogenase/urease accessory protein HupE
MRISAKNLCCKHWPIALWISLWIIFFAVNIFAHDLGLSSLYIEYPNQKLITISVYSGTEINKICSLDDKEKMTGLAKESAILTVDGKAVDTEDETDFTVNEGHEVIFRRVFSGISGKKLDIQSGLLAKLSPEHRQYLTISRSDGVITKREILTKDNSSITLDFENISPDTSFSKFLPLGIEHILFGYDHLLFLFALLLTVKSFGEIIKIVTSFTVAHSITLTLAALNIIQISPKFIEPLIAVSIIFVGIENLVKSEQKNRWMLTYAFGLIHGFGFASALQEVGIGSGFGVTVPLLSFNLGVEIGQMAVVLLILPILWKLRNFEIYTNRLVPIGSGLVPKFSQKKL